MHLFFSCPSVYMSIQEKQHKVATGNNECRVNDKKSMPQSELIIKKEISE